MRLIPLKEAFLCADLQCNTISDCPHRCPVCHSHVICLGTVLDGKKAAK